MRMTALAIAAPRALLAIYRYASYHRRRNYLLGVLGVGVFVSAWYSAAVPVAAVPVAAMGRASSGRQNSQSRQRRYASVSASYHRRSEDFGGGGTATSSAGAFVADSMRAVSVAWRKRGPSLPPSSLPPPPPTSNPPPSPPPQSPQPPHSLLFRSHRRHRYIFHTPSAPPS